MAELHKQPRALKLKEVNLGGCNLLCDVSTSRPRPIVPPLWTKTIFEAIHNLSHPGHKPTTRVISARYVWPGLKREVKNMVRACHSCQASKIGRHTKHAYSAGPKLPPPTVQPHAQAPHSHAQATRVDANAGGETISDTQSNTRSGRTIKRPIRYRTILSARSF